MRPFHEYIYNCVKTVPDYYVLHFCSLDEAFEPFQSFQPLQIVLHSHESSEPSKSLENRHVHRSLSESHFQMIISSLISTKTTSRNDHFATIALEVVHLDVWDASDISIQRYSVFIRRGCYVRLDHFPYIMFNCI